MECDMVVMLYSVGLLSMGRVSLVSPLARNLSHEVAHVVQQRPSRPLPDLDDPNSDTFRNQSEAILAFVSTSGSKAETRFMFCMFCTVNVW